MRFLGVYCFVFHNLLFLDFAQGREAFNFGIADNIHIISDKAFRRSQENEFMAIGNVIITHGKDTVYGEKASLQFDTGQVIVEGNVRYVGQRGTLYGSKLNYNFKTKLFNLKNARILSDNYVVLGKAFSSVSDREIVCINAEYTTCHDCPESWSIFGRKVRIVLGEYIYIKHAYIKVKGVVVMYVPYIVLPIKKKRDSGLLFPKFGLDLEEGFRFQQPWFWAISNSADLTLTPSSFGKRGWGSEFQFRHTPRDGLWYELNSLHLMDRIYLPNKKDYEVSGTHTFRHFSEWEHHFNSSKNWNHHFYYNVSRDLDTNRGMNKFSNDRVQGTVLGGSSFIDFRANWLSLSTEGYFKRNQLYPEPRGFDHRYVQVLPEISFSLIPYRLFQSNIPLLHNLTFDIKGDATVFKQNHRQEGEFIRNATRYNLAPTLTWSLGKIGPIVGKVNATLDYQHYRFPYEVEQRSFTKRGTIYETEFFIELEKIFGLAYYKKVPLEKVLALESKLEKKDSILYRDYIGNIPPVVPSDGKSSYAIYNYSYRHTQQFKLKHYFLSDQKVKGNQRFLSQIQKNTGVGQFDPVDSIREKEFQLTNEVSRSSLPLNNTIELQWNNSLVRKTSSNKNLLSDGRSLRENFIYDKISFLNISQGYDFNIQSREFEDRLTRLFVDTGINLKSFSTGIQEYYYYTTQEHIFIINLSKKFDRGKISSYLRYDTFGDQVNKAFTLGGEYQVNGRLVLRTFWDYDYEKDRTNFTNYEMIYSPSNNCWKLDLKYEKGIDDVKISFNFLFNFNKNNFSSLNEF